VTSFFRDPAAFDSLAESGLPKLLDPRPDGSDVRVWVPGCSTGEEAYSLAILLREYLGAQERSLRVQIFATDLDVAAIETARAGLYPSGIASDVTAERLRRWFLQEDGHYRVKKDIRDLVIFAPHDLLTDPPFTKLDLLSCRNLLIYLESRAQRRLMPLFHYALRPGGLLFLGAAESVDQTRPVLDGRSKVEDLPAGARQAPGAGRVSDRSREDQACGSGVAAEGARSRRPPPSPPRRAHAAGRAPGTPAWLWTSAARPSTSRAGPASISSPRAASPRTVWSEWRGRICAAT
jgi:chemotaxis methyl-accepting protein methylase